jgi:hypothetical protein
MTAQPERGTEGSHPDWRILLHDLMSRKYVMAAVAFVVLVVMANVDGAVRGFFRQSGNAFPQQVTCFKYENAAYLPGEEPFTRIKSSDVDRHRYLSTRALASLDHCPEGDCNGRALDSLDRALRKYLNARANMTWRYDAMHGDAGVRAVNQLFSASADRTITYELNHRVRSGALNVAAMRSGPLVWALVMMPPDDFRVCRE